MINLHDTHTDAARKRQLYELYLARACGVEFVQPAKVSHTHNPIAPHNPIKFSDDLSQRIIHCKLCGRSKRGSPELGYIQAKSPVIFVVEYAMSENGRLVDSKASQMLANIAHKVFGVAHFSVLSLLKCASHPASPQDIELCAPYLTSQLEAMPPACVVLFGEMVLESLLALDTSHKGALLEAFGKKTIATHSIAALLRNPSLKKDSLEHFRLLQSFIPR